MPRVDDDGPLVRQSQYGDVVAFAELVRRHARSAARLATRLLGNREDAEDAVQDAFAKAFANLARFRADSSFKTWLLHIVLNQAQDQLRRRRRRGPLASPEPVTEVSASSGRPGPFRRVAAQDEVRVLNEALDQLPPRQRAALLLKIYEGLPYEEVAGALGTTVPAARVYLSLARQSLRRRFERADRRRGGEP